MGLRRLSLLLLATGCLVPGSGSPHPVRPQNGDSCVQRAAINLIVVPAQTSARPSSTSPFSPWSYRLKSVLPETDPLDAPEADLGPVPLPDRFYSSVVQTRSSDLSRTAIPLRC
jgi:hypothetical protein